MVCSFFFQSALSSIRLKLFVLFAGLVISGCTTTPYNYDKLRAAKPRSILVLPPINHSTDVKGTYSYLSTITRPLAEKGYYVYPVAIIDHMMKENGLPTPHEMHQASLKKIKEILNPDAVLYLTIEQYGTKFVLLQSQTTVAVSARLVSAIDGEVLWAGRAITTKATSGNGTSLGAMIINAVVDQAVNSTADYAHSVSYETNSKLFFGKDTGLLNGPYNIQPDK